MYSNFYTILPTSVQNNTSAAIISDGALAEIEEDPLYEDLMKRINTMGIVSWVCIMYGDKQRIIYARNKIRKLTKYKIKNRTNILHTKCLRATFLNFLTFHCKDVSDSFPV